MIKASFPKNAGGFAGFSVSGHAGFAPEGEDIVCASVTSAVQLTANAVTEILGILAEVSVGEDEISLTLPPGPDEGGRAFLQALHLHLTLLQQEYPNHITITVSEV